MAVVSANKLELLQIAVHVVDEEGVQDLPEQERGAREAARPDIQLFPNPTSGALNLSTQGQTVYLIELFSPTGQLLWRRAGSIRDGEAIQLGHLPDGLYYVRLRVGQGMAVRKVVVRR